MIFRLLRPDHRPVRSHDARSLRGSLASLDGALQAQEYTAQEIVDSGHKFFGATSGGLATVVEKAFASYGLPNGYVLGEEGSGAIVGGLTYGEGTLYTKNAGDHKVFWQGPSLGWDFGGEGSRIMMLVYNLNDVQNLYDRFAGVAGSAYVVAGVGFNVLKNGDMLLVPIRTGVGARLGINIGYLKLTPEADLEPVLTERTGAWPQASRLRQATDSGHSEDGEVLRCLRRSAVFRKFRRDPVRPVLCPRLPVRRVSRPDGGARHLAPRCGHDAQAHRSDGSADAGRDPGRQGPHARRIRHVDPQARNERQGIPREGRRPDRRHRARARGTQAARQ